MWGASHGLCNLLYKISVEILVFFHNRSNIDYNFVLSESTKEFKRQFGCIGQNTEKYISFIVSI